MLSHSVLPYSHHPIWLIPKHILKINYNSLYKSQFHVTNSPIIHAQTRQSSRNSLNHPLGNCDMAGPAIHDLYSADGSINGRGFYYQALTGSGVVRWYDTSTRQLGPELPIKEAVPAEHGRTSSTSVQGDVATAQQHSEEWSTREQRTKAARGRSAEKIMACKAAVAMEARSPSTEPSGTME